MESCKKVFDTFDSDGSGCISLAELSEVLKRIANFSEKDCKILFEQTDKSLDGRLDFREFCDWMGAPLSDLSRQSARMSAQTSLALGCPTENSQWASLLRPLFEIFDQDKTGSISVDEFKQCHAILRGAISRHAPEDAAGVKKCIIERSSTSLFEKVDVSGEGQVTLDEFCEWQRRLLPESGREFDELQEMIEWITKELSFVLATSVVKECGSIVKADGHDSEDWEYALKSLSDGQHQLWRSGKEEKLFSKLDLLGTSGAMSEPPRATASSDPCRCLHVAQREKYLTIRSLLKIHLADYPISREEADSFQYAKFCVPLLPEKMDEHGLRWVTLLLRKVLLKDGRTEQSTSTYQFTGDRKRLWEQLPDASTFIGTVRTMPPEIKYLWLLKTEADMKNSEVSWGEIQRSFQAAEDFGIIDAELRQILHERAHKLLEKAGLVDYIPTAPKERFTPVSHAWQTLMFGAASGPHVGG